MNRRLLVVLCAACLGLTASSAGARIGNPIKKAKEKLQKATEQKAEPEAAPAAAGDDVVFDNTVVELTDARVQGIVAAFQKAKAAGAERSALVDRLSLKNEERGKLMDKEGDAMSDLRNKRDDINRCYLDGYEKAKDRKMEEYKTRALSDPQLMAKFAKVAQENNAAIARGDSTALQRSNDAMLGEMLPSREDSAKVRQSCGALPPKSAAETKLEGLDKDIASLNEQIRLIDQKVAKAQAKESGLTEQQWSIALERTQMYLGASASANAPRARKSKLGIPSGDGNATGNGNPSTGTVQARKGFTKAEVEVLEKHRAELRAAFQ